MGSTTHFRITELDLTEPETMFVYGFWLATMLIASLHGFILSGIQFLNGRFNTKANRHLAISILMVSIILMYEWMYFLEETLSLIHI